MNLFSELEKAYDSGIKKFIHSKELIKVYIVPMKCQRKEFYTALTEKEVNQLKLKVQRECWVIGETEKEKSTWEKVQDNMNSPEVKKYDEIVRYINAERRAEKLRIKMKTKMEQEKKKAEDENGAKEICRTSLEGLG